MVTRTIYLLFTDLTYNSGRSELQKNAMSLFNEHILTGLGAASDFDMLGQYPHNIVIEILYDYGLLFGSLLIIIIATSVIFFLRQKNNRDISIVFLSLGLFHLTISGTYLTSWEFYMLLGLIVGKYL